MRRLEKRAAQKLDEPLKTRLKTQGLAFFRRAGVLFRAVTAARLATAFDAGRVQGSANDLVTNAREVANAAAANKNDRVFLQFVAFARDVNGNFFVVRETNARDATKSGVRFFRLHRANQEADAAFLRAAFENRGLRVAMLLFAVFTHQLINGRH